MKYLLDILCLGVAVFSCYATFWTVRWLMPHIRKFQDQVAEQSYREIDWSYAKNDAKWLWSRVFGFLLVVGIAGIGSFLFRLRLLAPHEVTHIYFVGSFVGCIGLVAGMLLVMLPLPLCVYRAFHLLPSRRE